ncbi:MAG: hypothetical protein HKN88_08130 [Gammaproteobacteria bacterium]|nr:hypothetical protein [Gammaproteobacteria bacterium]
MFKQFKTFKWLLVILAILLCVVTLNVILNLAEGSLSLWERLQTAPIWLTAPFVILSVALVGFTLWFIWSLLGPRKKPQAPEVAAPVSAESVAQKYREAEAKGIDVNEAFAALEQWREEKQSGEIIVAFLGNISVGKSSLIKAMLPNVEQAEDIAVDVLGGSTRATKKFVWHSAAGDQLILEDVPGLQEVTAPDVAPLDKLALEAAQRAHVCVFVTEGDITKTEHAALRAMLELNKPTILVLNKADRFQAHELAEVSQKLSAYVSEIVQDLSLKLEVPVVTTISGGEEIVEVQQQDGSVLQQSRARQSDTQKLVEAIQATIDTHAGWLESLRDSAVFVLVDRKLDKAETRFKQEQAEKIVKTYTKRAIFGAMAAVAPGSDLLIQGYLGKQMVNEISAVYDIEARKVDVQTFLELVEQHLQKALPVVLAIAGNGLKAFPGIGTITGGIAHAGAYGLIFDALGRSLSASMAVRGTLSPAPAATQFKDYLNENLALGTRRFAQLVLEARKENRSD